MGKHELLTRLADAFRPKKRDGTRDGTCFPPAPEVIRIKNPGPSLFGHVTDATSWTPIETVIGPDKLEDMIPPDVLIRAVELLAKRYGVTGASFIRGMSLLREAVKSKGTDPRPDMPDRRPEFV